MTCHKKPFPDKAAAKSMAKRMTSARGKKHRVYQCPKCGAWHMTTITADERAFHRAANADSPDQKKKRRRKFKKRNGAPSYVDCFMMPERILEVIEKYKSQGLELDRVHHKGDWTKITFRQGKD